MKPILQTPILRLAIPVLLLALIAGSTPLAYATSYQDWVSVSTWQDAHYLSHVPNAVGTYDHASVYVMIYSESPLDWGWFAATHTLQTQVRFSVNPNDIVYMDIYASGNACSAYFPMSSTLITNAYSSGGYWWYSPSNSGFDPQGMYYDGGHGTYTADCNFEIRLWDNGSQTVYTSQIRWNGVGS